MSAEHRANFNKLHDKADQLLSVPYEAAVRWAAGELVSLESELNDARDENRELRGEIRQLRRELGDRD